MIISNKQLTYLMLVFKDSLPLVDGFSLSQSDRMSIYNRIVNQQSDELINRNEENK